MASSRRRRMLDYAQVNFDENEPAANGDGFEGRARTSAFGLPMRKQDHRAPVLAPVAYPSAAAPSRYLAAAIRAPSVRPAEAS